MSMEVDLNSPLTGPERDYLRMRGRYAEIERVDALHGVDDAPAAGEGDGTGPKVQQLMTSEARAQRREALLEELRQIEDLDGDSGNDEDLETVAPYQEWAPKELDAELKRRNLQGGGTKAEKVDRLYSDDAAADQTPA